MGEEEVVFLSATSEQEVVDQATLVVAIRTASLFLDQVV